VAESQLWQLLVSARGPVLVCRRNAAALALSLQQLREAALGLAERGVAVAWVDEWGGQLLVSLPRQRD
jgi:hypothetical protein